MKIHCQNFMSFIQLFRFVSALRISIKSIDFRKILPQFTYVAVCTAVSTWFLADKSTDFLTQKNHKLNISNRDYLLTSCNQEQSHVDHE